MPSDYVPRSCPPGKLGAQLDITITSASLYAKAEHADFERCGEDRRCGQRR